jgi:D-glycero-alpha-D-manno-heptose-7-phosphate kinase
MGGEQRQQRPGERATDPGDTDPGDTDPGDTDQGGRLAPGGAGLRARTPLRVSFFGGGTDYPEYLGRSRGAVVGMAIDRYVHVTLARPAGPGAARSQVSDARIGAGAAAVEADAHPVVGAVLRHYAAPPGLRIGVAADLPARSGLGGSSAFAVGLLHLLFALQGRPAGKRDLAQGAVFVERELLGQPVGLQDPFHAAFGGLNRFDFVDGETRVTQLVLPAACAAALTGSLFLLATGVARAPGGTLDEQLRRTESGAADRDLSHLLALTEQAVAVLQGGEPTRLLAEFGALLHEGWETKKRLSSRVSAPAIDLLYAQARAAGALGGKLCGAGGGGYLLLLVPPARQAGFLAAMRGARLLPIGLDRSGSVLLPA